MFISLLTRYCLPLLPFGCISVQWKATQNDTIPLPGNLKCNNQINHMTTLVPKFVLGRLWLSNQEYRTSVICDEFQLSFNCRVGRVNIFHLPGRLSISLSNYQVRKIKDTYRRQKHLQESERRGIKVA